MLKHSARSRVSVRMALSCFSVLTALVCCGVLAKFEGRGGLRSVVHNKGAGDRESVEFGSVVIHVDHQDQPSLTEWVKHNKGESILFIPMSELDLNEVDASYLDDLNIDAERYHVSAIKKEQPSGLQFTFHYEPTEVKFHCDLFERNKAVSCHFYNRRLMNKFKISSDSVLRTAHSMDSKRRNYC